MNTKKIKKLLSEISPWPWCEDYCYEAIRHVSRNCDIECLAHEDLDECKSFGRYDGSFISKAPEIIDQLLRQNEILRKALVFYTVRQEFLACNEVVAQAALLECDEIEIEND